MTFVEFNTESAGSPGDLAGKTQGGSHAEETEEAVAATESLSFLDTRAVRIESGSHASDEAKDDGIESPNLKMRSLAGDMPRYDEIDDDDEEEGDADDDEYQGDDRIKGKDGGSVPFDPVRANRNSLILLSLLLGLAMPVVLWRFFNQPLIVVWRLSLLLCCCCTIWTGLLAISLSTQMVLLRLGFFIMLALYVDGALDPKIGMLIMNFNSHFAVGMMGYAVAERRQHDGTEVSAALVRVPSDEKQAERLLCAQILGGFYFGVITLGFLAGVAWVMCHVADFTVEQLVMAVSGPLSGVLVLWITFVGSMLLQGTLFAEAGFSVLITYFVLTTLFYALFVMTIGEMWAMILAWPLMLGFSGLLGYCICVYSSFKLRMRLGLPPLKLDETKEDSSMKALLENQGHGSDDLRHGDVGAKAKVA